MLCTGTSPCVLCTGLVTCQQRQGLRCDLAQRLVARSTRTALARVFSFLWRVQSPEEISSRVTVPSFEPQPTTHPLSCRRRLERGSSQTWGGRAEGWWHLALTQRPAGEVRADRGKSTRSPITEAYVQIFGACRAPGTAQG